jgi:thiol:disulfide interchange protein
MVTFKQIVGFVLIAVVVWLLSILINMVDRAVLLGTLGLLAAVGSACWLIGKITLSDSAGRAAVLWLTSLAVAVAGGLFSFWVFSQGASAIPWQHWEPGIAERLAEQGYTVYVDYTATWCLTCQANKKVVLERPRIAREFEKLGIYPIEADFTNYDKTMQKELNRHGRNGVPLNIVVPAGKPNEPIILPEILRPAIVLDALRQAGPSRSAPTFWSEKPHESRVSLGSVNQPKLAQSPPVPPDGPAAASQPAP